MKKVVKSNEPKGLKVWRIRNPHSHWNAFKIDKPAYTEVQGLIKSDQAGLCAYCEIDLKPATSGTQADFRVEHFHPKSDNSTSHNWHLDWPNLLACCHGGSQKNVVDAAIRYSSPDHSCDVPKGNRNLDNVILNPLLLPDDLLFKFNRSDGSMEVNQSNCQAAGVNADKAQATIVELKLDTLRLRRLRKVKLDSLNAQLRMETDTGLSLGQARIKLAKAHLKKSSDNHWPSFFSAIRSYLGNAAEQQLQIINYIG
ncbi:MAG: TIGR02646 family protein [Pseudomonas sp.]|nr:TIGR02646 family protein [Pseudomonas sp.]